MATSVPITRSNYPAPRDLQFDQVEDLLKLQKAAQKITSILDLDQLIDKVVHEIASSFGVPTGTCGSASFAIPKSSTFT